VGHALKLGAAGTVIGVLIALLLMRSMRPVLFGVSPADPATFAGIALLLPLVAVLASVLPGLKATKVDPIVALRQE
jgi:putative ABC transport system permease protein